MKVLHIVGGLPTPERPFHQPFIKSQIESLVKEGIDCSVYEIKGYYSRFEYIKAIWEIRKLFKVEKFDLIHSHYSYCALVPILARVKVPIILSLMGDDLLGTPNDEGKLTIRGVVDRNLTKIIIRYVNYLIVKSDRMKKYIKRKTPVETIPNGVNFLMFKPEDKIEVRKKLGLNIQSFIVLFLGNPKEARKNIKLAIESVDKFRENYHSNIELINPFGSEFSKIVDYMNASDVLLLTSFWEGSPNVIKEAMACNLPIISTDVGDVKNIIHGTEYCYIVPFSSDVIKEKLYSLHLVNKRTNGRKNVDNLRIEIIAQKLRAVYENVVEKSHRE